MRTAWLILVCLLTAFQLWFSISVLLEEKLRVDAREDIRRLTKVMVTYFKDRDIPSAEVFWKGVGRTEPVKDPWGSPYELILEDRGTFLWRSAGPDRRPNTGDDIEVKAPFVYNLAPNEDLNQSATPWSRDAM